MLVRRCSHTLNHQLPRYDLAAALAQLPSFLVPLFTGQLEGCSEGAQGRTSSRPLRGRSAPSPRLPSSPSPASAWRPSSLHPATAYSPHRPPLFARAASTSAEAVAVEAASEEKNRAERTSELEEGVRGSQITGSLSSDRQPPRTAVSKRRSHPKTRRASSPPFPLASPDLPFDSSSFPSSVPEITSYLLALPRALPLPYLLHLRSLLKTRSLLSNPSLVSILTSRLLSQEYDDAARRLMNECGSLVRSRLAVAVGGLEGDERRDLEEGLREMYERALRQVTRRPLKHRVPWPLVVELTQSALTRGVVSPLILSVRMRGLYEAHRFVDVIATFALFEQHGLEPRGGDYDEVILARLLNLDLEEAQRLLREKGDKGFPTTGRTCLALLEGMAPYGGNKVMEEKMLLEATVEALEKGEAPRQDVRALNKVLSVRAGREDTEDVVKVLEYYDFSDYPPALVKELFDLAPSSSPSTRPSLSSHDTPSPSSSTLDTLEDPTSPFPPSPPPSAFPRPAPDLATLVILIGLSLRLQRHDLALLLLRSAHTLDLGFNHHLASSVVRTLLALHDVTAAEEFVSALPRGEAILAGMRYPEFVPSMKVFEVLFGGILRYRGVEGANAALERFGVERKASVRVTEGLSRALVSYLALEAEKKATVSADILLELQRMTSGKVRPTAKHLDMLLRAAWQTERTRRTRGTGWEEEFAMPKEEDLAPLPRAEAARPPPIPRPAPIPTDALPSAGPPSSATSSTSSSSDSLPAEADLLAPTPSSRALSSYNLPSSSLTRLRDSLTDRHAKPLRSTSRHILRNEHLLRFIPAKWAYLQSQLLDLGVRPTVHHVAVLLRAYLVLGDAKGAHLALKYAFDELNIPPHVALYSTLVAGLARLGKHDEAMNAFEEMKTRRLEPDRTLFAALAMSCARRRNLAGVQAVLEQVRKHARAKAVHPQLVALARSQALRSRSSSSPGVPATLLTPYDPSLDPVFVAILFRTLSSVGRLRDAQEMVKEGLERGLVPDEVLVMELRRSEKWVRRKRNNASGATPVVSPSSSSTSADKAEQKKDEQDGANDTSRPALSLTTEIGTGFAKVGTSSSSPTRLTLPELDTLLSLTTSNISRALQLTRGMKHELSRRSLGRMKEYWREAEREKKFKERGSRRDRRTREEREDEEDRREEDEVLGELEDELRRIELEAQKEEERA